MIKLIILRQLEIWKKLNIFIYLATKYLNLDYLSQVQIYLKF